MKNLRALRPLVQCLTNAVTVNDVANIILACGASPVMAVDIREMEDFVSLAQAVLVNIGTLDETSEHAAEAALACAARLARPVVLDPVGVGAGKYRTEMVKRWLDKWPVTVIRANASEIRALHENAVTTKGVDAADADAVNAETLPDRTRMAADVATKYHCVVAMSGAWDVITDGSQSLVCRRGVPMMSRITGTGCMLGGLTAAFVATRPAQPLQAAYDATEFLCLCGEEAARKTDAIHGGTASFRNFLLDAVSLA
ncbi:MAG: hydroxyethylthiazole kinase [Lentisphaeria bacterium]|nr:hydroxyethylthiazole kinase [Lentisphaeria bacterium]